MADPKTTETPAETVTTLIPVASALVQVAGGQKYKINPETTARQVKLSDGVDIETRLNTIEAAASAKARTFFAETIAERDALEHLNPGDKVLVFDASGDETVEKGGASYVYLPEGAGFRKTSEDESMDVVCDWEHVKNRPESAPAQIDLAVAKQHAHDNKTTIDLLTHDGGDGEVGNLLFNGRRISDGKVWVAHVASVDAIPTNLADGGLVFVDSAE